MEFVNVIVDISHEKLDRIFQYRIPEELQGKISTGIQETAHVQGWKHMKVQKDMRPPGFVVTHPDTAVTVHADIGRTGEHQDPFIRL